MKPESIPESKDSREEFGNETWWQVICKGRNKERKQEAEEEERFCRIRDWIKISGRAFKVFACQDVRRDGWVHARERSRFIRFVRYHPLPRPRHAEMQRANRRKANKRRW